MGKKSEAVLQGRISQHDKYQIEMKFTFPVTRERKLNDYHIDLFFFLPRNLEVNCRTFTAERFYHNMYEYIRFKTPVVRLSRLASADNQPLLKLRRAIRELKSSRQEAENRYIERLKMYCSIVKSGLRDELYSINGLPMRETVNAAELYMEECGNTVLSFRALRRRLQKPEISDEHRELFDLVDEFISITICSSLYELYNILEKHPDAGSNDLQELKKRISPLVTQEIKYRKSRGYPSIPDPEGGNSELLYRESTLKKAMAGVLSLKIEPKRAGVWMENLLYNVAAAVAMSAALGILFIWKGLSLGEFSLAFFLLYVGSYIVREQIKRSMQDYFAENRNRYSCDYRKIIRDNMNHVLGMCKERFGFCQGNAINREIATLRNRTSLSKLENGSLTEEVLEFRKMISFHSDRCSHIFNDFPVAGVVDILRFNVRAWLEKMDNPVKEISAPDPEHKERMIAIKAHRVYHVNMVLRYGAEGLPDQYARYRLILCRNGIRAIEKVSDSTIG